MKLKFYSLIVIVAVILLMAIIQADQAIIDRHQAASYQQVQDDLSDIESRLTVNLCNNTHVVMGLSALFIVNPSLTQQEFAVAARAMFDEHAQLRNVSAAPDLVIRYMYPIAGNEAAIGVDYRTLPHQIEAIVKAKKSQQLVLAGPVELIQGGMGLISRLPVFIKDVEGKESFWGIVATVIDANLFYQESGLFDADLSIEIAIRGKDGLGKDGEVFFGDPELFKSSKLKSTIPIHNGSWQIVARPIGGWKSLPEDIWQKRLLLVGIAGLLFGMIFAFLRALMNAAIANLKFRNLIENSPVPYALNNEKKQITFLNKACINTYGYTLKDIPTISAWWEKAYPDPSDREQARLLWVSYFEKVQSSNDVATPLEFSIRCKDGSTRIALISITKNYNIKGTEYPIILYDITERKQAEILLSESEARWQFALEGNRDGVWDWNVVTGEVYFSTRFKQMLGYEDDEMEGTVDEWYKRIHPDDKAQVDADLEKYFNKETPFYISEFRMLCKDGLYRWRLARGKVISWTEDHKPLRMIGTHMDITDQKHAENSLRIAATAFESQEGMMITDAKKNILRVNKAFTRITGYSAEEVSGHNPRMLSSGRQNALFYDEMWKEINTNNYWEGEIWNRHKNGEKYLENITITAVQDSKGVVTNYVGTMTDITLSKQAEQEIENLAYYDPLTNLPNRRLMLDRIRHAMAASARSGNKGALLFLDLDHFKMINDTLGHDMGDLLLKQVSKNLTTCIREGDTVSRFGGDEFVVLLEGLSAQPIEAAAQAEDIANKILTTINRSYQLAGHDYTASTSIGITLLDDHKSEVADLLKQADLAMYQAKADGRNALCFFDPQMQSTITAHAELEKELKQAIAQQQFQLYYQIQIDNSGHPLGAEALIRWNHPERGLILPLDFIPMAEQNGTIGAICQWILNTVCAQLNVWQQDAFTRDLTLSVNISAKQFRQAGFIAQVMMIVKQHEINPARLKFELTESLLLDDIEGTIVKMKELADIGIQFSLDDFGTGYSSLQYLKRLPLYQLKIDKSFVDDLVSDSNDQVIVHTIIVMAHSLGLSVIAEGVESVEQQQRLLNEGCTHYQGYLFGKPVPIDVFEILLKKFME